MNDAYLNQLLWALLGRDDLVQQWWTTPNLAFGQQCPCDADPEKVKIYLEWNCYG